MSLRFKEGDRINVIEEGGPEGSQWQYVQRRATCLIPFSPSFHSQYFFSEVYDASSEESEECQFYKFLESEGFLQSVDSHDIIDFNVSEILKNENRTAS